MANDDHYRLDRFARDISADETGAQHQLGFWIWKSAATATATQTLGARPDDRIPGLDLSTDPSAPTRDFLTGAESL